MNVLHGVIQGTPEWLAVRAKHDTASEAPAALGVSKYIGRAELLKQKALGIVPEVNSYKQALFDQGHAAEAAARTLAEEIVGDDLYAITVACEFGGLKLLASLDGSTMSGRDIWEHKLYSAELAAQVEAGTLARHYTVQMDQELLVSGAKRCLFMTSDGTRDRMAWCWYETTPERQRALIDGWRQFREDLDAYIPEEVKIDSIAAVIDALPALSATVEGRVIDSNLGSFRIAASAFLAQIKTDLQTDDDFANAAATVKFCEDGEARLKLVKAQVLGQTASIDELFATIDAISAEMRAKRLALDKLVEARKTSIRAEIATNAQAALDEHHRKLLARLGHPWITRVLGPFAEAMKNKRTVVTCKEAVDAALANAKIAMSALADRIETNRKALIDEAGEDWMFLFADFAAVAGKEAEDFKAIVQYRVMQHREAQKARDAKIAADAVAAAAVAAPPPVPAPAVAPVTSSPLQTYSAAADTRPPITTGALCAWLGFIVNVEFIKGLGITPAAPPATSKARSGSYWNVRDFPAIKAALVRHINALPDSPVEATAEEAVAA